MSSACPPGTKITDPLWFKARINVLRETWNQQHLGTFCCMA